MKKFFLIVAMVTVCLSSTGCGFFVRNTNDGCFPPSPGSDLCATYSSACAAYTVVQTDEDESLHITNEATFRGTDESGLGFETMVLLGKAFDASELEIVANEERVLRVTYKEYMYDAEKNVVYEQLT